MVSYARCVSFLLLVGLLSLGLASGTIRTAEAGGKTIVVSAEGLADPNAETYQRDKGLMLEDLRRDARKQVIEKAVGTFVDSSTLTQNYALVSDRVLTKTQGLIKNVIKETPPWVGDDGFAHLMLKAEVYVDDVRSALQEMSRTEKVALIKEHGNPKVSVAILVMDAERDSGTRPMRSDVAENIVKERIKGFGYRVWSEEHTSTLKTELIEKSTLDGQTEVTVSAAQSKAADFAISGEAKFKKISHTLSVGNVQITKYTLTSWTVKCIDTHTGEEILYNNQIPKGKAWSSEDEAIESIGRLIGEQFSKDFFTEHLQAPSKTFQLQVLGLPNYDLGQELKKEFIGLRPVLNVDFRDFDKNGLSLYEVDFAGSGENFNQLLNSTVLAPLNQKLGGTPFSLDSAHGNVVRVAFRSDLDAQELMRKLNTAPPASLATAPPERLKEVIKSEETLKKVAEVAPDAAKKLENDGFLDAGQGADAVKSF